MISRKDNSMRFDDTSESNKRHSTRIRASRTRGRSSLSQVFIVITTEASPLTPRTDRGRKISFYRETGHKQCNRITSRPVYESLHRVGRCGTVGNGREPRRRCGLLSRVVENKRDARATRHAGIRRTLSWALPTRIRPDRITRT